MLRGFNIVLRRCLSESREIVEKITPQAGNRVQTWSKSQRAKVEIFQGPRFTQIDMTAQPSPLAAIELIREDPVRMAESRQASCNGDGVLGHPKVFINLETGAVISCKYCGRKFQQDHVH